MLLNASINVNKAFVAKVLESMKPPISFTVMTMMQVKLFVLYHIQHFVTPEETGRARIIVEQVIRLRGGYIASFL